MRKIAIPVMTIILCFLLVMFLPLDVPYNLEVPGVILSEKEWIIVRNQDGSLIATLHDNLHSTVESYMVNDVENGDRLTFTMYPFLADGVTVAMGDTIGSIVSSEIEYRLAELKGELAAEEATLKLYDSGEKEPLVNEARLQLEYARKQVEQQTREVARLKNLADKRMIPEADMEREETTLRLYEIQATIEEARIRALTTGSKKEQIEQIQARIEALRRDIDVLQRRADSSVLCSPISGFVTCSTTSDTLAVVYGSDSYVVVMPINWKERNNVSIDNPIELTLDGLDVKPSGAIKHIDKTAVLLNGCNVLRTAAVIDRESEELSNGLYARCQVRCPALPVKQYVIKYLGY